jgi:hypothetical protein
LLLVVKLKTVPLFPQVRTSLLQDLIALVNLLDIDVLGNAGLPYASVEPNKSSSWKSNLGIVAFEVC